MHPSPTVPYFIELLVPSAETEQEFLLLAVQAAVKKYREAQHTHAVSPQTTRHEVGSLQENAH